jgi:serine/threonine-protein kinase
MFLDTLTGQSLGQYQLRELLGVGGMGAVYRGFQESLQREVAVKIIFMRQTSNLQYEERFAREARLAASLEHTHIVPVYDFGTEHGVSYVVMRLLTGGSLSERIIQSNGGLLPLTEVARITSDLASALQYAHNRGIIHRDIKASNIMFDDRDTVFLVDFGIAKMAAATTHNITDTGVKIGTPEFMAPELWLNEPVTPAVDQYSLAILVYYMLTGSLPFKGEMPYQLMHSHLHEQPTPLLYWRSDLPGNLMPVLERALSKDPASRYPNVEAFAAAFSQAVQESFQNAPYTIQLAKKNSDTIILPDPPLDTPAPRPKTRRSLIAAAALIAAAIGFFALLSSSSGRGDVNAADNPTASATSIQVAAVTEELTATNTATATATNTPTITPSATKTATDIPTSTPTQTATSTDTPAPTAMAMAGDPATITLPLLSFYAGERGVIEAEVDCATESCRTFDITIQFDPQVIQVEGIETGPFLGEQVDTTRNLIDNAAGEIRLAAAALEQPDAADKPVLLRLNIQARNPGVSQLRIAHLDVSTQSGDPLYAVGVDGGVIVSGAATEQPTCQYRVQTGDTLSGIALANGVTIDQIIALNDIPDRSIVRVGQVLVIPAADCRAPVMSSPNQSMGANSQIIEVHDCRYLGNNVFEWYSVRRDFDSDGNPIRETRIGGPYSGAWQPGCPGGSGSITSGGGSSGGSSSGGSSSGGGGSGSGSENPPPEEDDDDGGLGGVICGLLGC